MELSLLSWLALLTFYVLYILLGGCMFNRIEDQKIFGDNKEEDAERSREIKGPSTYDIRIEGGGGQPKSDIKKRGCMDLAPWRSLKS